MLGIIIAFMLLASPAAARDFGQWQDQSPDVRKWFQKLMQPDVPLMSCCGEADAYWADSFEVDEDRYVAIITDERPDGPTRPPAPGVRRKDCRPKPQDQMGRRKPHRTWHHLHRDCWTRLLLRTAGRRLSSATGSPPQHMADTRGLPPLHRSPDYSLAPGPAGLWRVIRAHSKHSSNRASSNGLLKKQTAPAFIARSRIRSWGKAVMKMIGVPWS